MLNRRNHANCPLSSEVLEEMRSCTLSAGRNEDRNAALDAELVLNRQRKNSSSVVSVPAIAVVALSGDSEFS